MKTIKKVLGGLFALALMVALFTGTGMEARAAEQIEVEITYIYVDNNGNNAIYIDSENVDAGTTWGSFFSSYAKCYENGTISNANAGNNWNTVSVQNTLYNDISQCSGNPITKFNSYVDVALVTFYGIPTGYRHGFYSFQALKKGEHIDSGTGWDFLVPTANEYGSEAAIEYAKDNLRMYDYIWNYCNVPGATWEVTAPRTPSQGQWDGYLVTINLPAGSSTKNSDTSDKNIEKQEVQTPENNYGVFQESVKQSVDTAIAAATKAAQEAAVAGKTADVKPVAIDTGVWISFKGDVYKKLQDSGLPVQITFFYKGARYRVDIPAGADLMSLVDENGYCGFLNLMAHFGGTKL